MPWCGMQGWFHDGKEQGCKESGRKFCFLALGCDWEKRVSEVRGAGFPGAKATSNPKVPWGDGVCTGNSWVSHAVLQV